MRTHDSSLPIIAIDIIDVRVVNASFLQGNGGVVIQVSCLRAMVSCLVAGRQEKHMIGGLPMKLLKPPTQQLLKWAIPQYRHLDS